MALPASNILTSSAIIPISSTLSTHVPTLTHTTTSPTTQAFKSDFDITSPGNHLTSGSRKHSMGLLAGLVNYLTLSSLSATSNHVNDAADKGINYLSSNRGPQNQAPLLSGSPSRTYHDLKSFWTSGHEHTKQWTEAENGSRTIPQYVYDHTPYVHLFSGEQFWPCDIAEHLVHTSPYLNYTLVRQMENDRTLENLNELNEYGRFMYLKSEDDVEERPEWLGGSRNIPRNPEELHTGARVGGLTGMPQSRNRNSQKHSADLHNQGGHSSAPAVLVVVPKEDGIVDAFWFYFYSYNLGNQVLNVRFGNHVGDWEHSMVRFRNGTPEAVYVSEHGGGQAYAYHAVEKIGKRPVIYSATGTHAMYATAGLHPYVLPFGLLHDQTDRGPLWDPNLNHHAYLYNHTSRVLKSSAQTPRAPVNWFYYNGRWGDKIYPLSDSRQYRFAGQYHYVSGPTGPRFKNLGRKNVCQVNGHCDIRHWLGDDGKTKTWPGLDNGEEAESEVSAQTQGQRRRQ